MFNILMIDDDIDKIEAVCALMDENSDVYFDYELEVKNACRKLENKRYDLVIIDIQLPSFGKQKDKGGLELLDLIESLDEIKKPLYIVGLTSHDENYDDISNEFQDSLWILLKYDLSNDEWKDKLINKIEYLRLAKNAMSDEIHNNKENNFDCAIITAVQTEFEAIYNCGIEWEKTIFTDDPTTYYTSSVKYSKKNRKIVLARQHQMGMVAAATLASKTINNFYPKIVCMVGITAGREGEVKLGDILVASESWDYGSGKIKDKKDENSYILEPEPHMLAIEPEIKEFFLEDFSDILYQIRTEWNKSNGIKMESDINLIVAPLASGAAVIQSNKVVTEFIQPQDRKIAGIDMETYAIYYATKNSKKPSPKYLSIKSVCDYANQYKNNDFQKYAAFSSAKFLLRILEELLLKIE